MSNIEGGAPIIRAGISGDGGKRVGAGSVAVRIVQRVIAEERKILDKSMRRGQAHAAVQYELILFENPLRLIGILNLARRRRYRLAWRNRLCIDEIRIQLMVAT